MWTYQNKHERLMQKTFYAVILSLGFNRLTALFRKAESYSSAIKFLEI